MPMMVVGEAEMELQLKALAECGTIERSEKVVNIERGRGEGKGNTPEELRKLIASDALAGCNVAEISQAYNVSASSISAYKHGSTSTASYNNPNPELLDSNNNTKRYISDRAERVITDGLSLLTLDKIAECKARDIAGIAKDMSAVVKNMTPDIGIQNNNQVVIFRPRMREEDDYEVIEIAN